MTNTLDAGPVGGALPQRRDLRGQGAPAATAAAWGVETGDTGGAVRSCCGGAFPKGSEERERERAREGGEKQIG